MEEKKYSQGEQIIEEGEIHQQGEVHEDDLLIQSSAEGRKLFDEIIQVTEDFHNKFRIGIGGKGSVYKVQLESIGTVAVKKLHALPDGRGYDKESLKELQALEGTGHQNIVKLYGYCIHRRVSFLIYEYFEKGSLANVLRNEDTARGLTWSSRFKVIKGVAAALSNKKNYSFADEDVLDQRPPAPTEPEKLKLANAYKLARRCVKKEPDGRPTMKDVFKNISQEYNSSRTLSDNASSSRTLLDN